jgi:exonuclease III
MKSIFIISLISLFNSFVYSTDTQCPDPSVYNNTQKDRRHDQQSLTLMQYNVEWLFLDYYSSSDCPGNGCTWKNESEALIHMDYVTSVIDTINPDIINFCEIEGCDELQYLVNNLSTSEYNPYLLKGTDTATGQNVGMLTRIDPIDSLNRSSAKIYYPVQGSKCGYTGNGTTGVSKHYVSHFKINNIDVAIISAHLIAFPTDKAQCSKREAQASILQSIIFDHIQNGYEVIMMGDFNDFDDEVIDMNNDIPTSMVLDILKGEEGNMKGMYTLQSVAQNIPQYERFSDWYDSDNNCNTSSKNDYSMIDHILVTKKLFDKITYSRIYHGYKEYCGKYNSDHYPVIVKFDF